MDAVADLTAKGSRIVLTNVVRRKEGNPESPNIVKAFPDVKGDDVFNFGPVVCEFGADYLRDVQKTTKENTERLLFLIGEQKKYIRKKGISLPFFTCSSKDKDEDKENRLDESVVGEEKDPGSSGKSDEADSDSVEPPTVEGADTEESETKRKEKSRDPSRKLAREFGWDSDEEPEKNEEKGTENRCPRRFSIDWETSRNLEANLPLADSNRSEFESDSEKEREYVSLYTSDPEKREDSVLPGSSKDAKSISVPEEGPAPYRNPESRPRFYSRNNMKRTWTETVRVTSRSGDTGGKVEITNSPEKAKDDENEGEPFFVISSVVGNADFVFTENTEESGDFWVGGNEEPIGNRSTITPKKTDDITKIKGWRKKQFRRGNDFSEESGPGRISDSEDPVENSDVKGFFPTEVIIKQEPTDETDVTDSAFVCDSLDDFLDKEADLKISYEIPHLYAEVGIKLTSDEIVSRPIINESESTIVPSTPDDRIRGYHQEKKQKICRSRSNESGIGKRTDDRKMRDRCIRNLIDYRYHYVSSGGKLVKVAGSYDSRPFVDQDGKQAKLAFWGNKTKAFDDIFNDLMEEDEVNEERAADRSVVLLHNRKSAPEHLTTRIRYETPPRSSGDEKTEATREIEKKEIRVSGPSPEIREWIIPDEEIPEKETEIRVESKLIGLTVYPGPYRPLPSLVQYHLRKLRNYRTTIDREWANFAVSALDFNRDPRKRARMILPVICPVLDSEKEPTKDYDLYCRQMLEPFRKGRYFKNFENRIDDGKIPVEVRETMDFILDSVENSTEGRKGGFLKKRRGKGKASNFSADQIISSDEKRTRKLPGRFKDTTILEEKIFPLALRSCDFSSPSVTPSDCPGRKPYSSRRWHEKMKEWQREHGLRDCSVVMHRMKGLARVAPWCMKHECYSCMPCRLKNPLSSKFFKFPNGKRRRPNSSWNKNSLGFTRNVALKRTTPRSLFVPRPEVYSVPVPVPDEKGETGTKNSPLPVKNLFPEVPDDEKEKEKKRFTLESVFEEEERSRAVDATRTVRQITFNKVVSKLLTEKLKDLKSTKTIFGTIDDLRRLRPNVIELIKLNFIKESFTCGYINIWYLKGKTASKSRAFLTFSKYPPVDGAVNLKYGSFSSRDLPKVITEIVSENGRFKAEDYAILHCDGSLWEIHGSVDFTVEKTEELERPVEETKIVYADEVIVSELSFMSRLHPGKDFDNPAKWWIMDLSQEYLEILTKVDGQIYKFLRENVIEYSESKGPRFINIGRHGSPIFGVYIIPSVLPYGLVGPYHLHENHGMELKIHEKTVPFIYGVPGAEVPRVYPDVVPAFNETPEETPPFGLKTLIRQTVSDFDRDHKTVVGMWLHDKTVKKEPSFLEIQTKLKKMPPPFVPKKNTGYDFTLEHDYSLTLRNKYFHRETAPTSSRTSGVDQSEIRCGKRTDDTDEDEPEFSVYLVPDIPNLGYVKGQLMSDHSVTIRHPLTPNRLINSLKIDEWLNNFLSQKIQFIPKDLKIKWRTVTDIENVGDEKPFNKISLGGTHILCQKGLFYMLRMNKTVLENIGLEKSEILSAISGSPIIKEVMEVKELGKLITMESECNLPIDKVLELAINEIKGLEARSEDLTRIKEATEKRKQKLCKQYTDSLKSSGFDDATKRKLFLKVKKKLLAIQEVRRKMESSESSMKPGPENGKQVLKKDETSEIRSETVEKEKSAKPIRRTPVKKEIKKEVKKEVDRHKPKSSKGAVSVLDRSKIRKKNPKPSQKQVPSTVVVDEDSGIKILDVQSMAPAQTEEEVPKVATEETVTTAEEVTVLRKSDIRKLEQKLANIYRLLRSKTGPDDTVEYKRLLSRLTTISRQLDKFKGVQTEEPSSVIPEQILTVERGVVETAPVQSFLPIQQMPQLRPLVLANQMQPIFLIVDPPAAPGSGNETTHVSGELNLSENLSNNAKYMSDLENAVFNGNKKFKIERKLERTIGKEVEPHYIVHKPYFPPDGLQNSPGENSEDLLPTITNVRSLCRNQSTDESTLTDGYSEVTGASNFLISVSKDASKKIRIVKNRPPEEGSREEVARDRAKSSRAEFIPLTSLNSSRNLTVSRESPRRSKIKVVPPKQGNPSILKSVLARPLSETCHLTDPLPFPDPVPGTDFRESRERTEKNGLIDGNESEDYVFGFVSVSEKEKKRKNVTPRSIDSVKKPRTEPEISYDPIETEKADSDEEPFFCRVNTEDIEKNFNTIIRPIVPDVVGTDQIVELKRPTGGF